MSLTAAALGSSELRSVGTGGFLLVASRAQPDLLHRLRPVAIRQHHSVLFPSPQSSKNRKPDASHDGVRTTYTYPCKVPTVL